CVGDDVDGMRGVRLATNEGISAGVAERDEAVLLESTTAHPAYSSRLDRSETALPGYCCAPLSHNGILGALSVAGRPNLGPEHKDLLVTLARQAAVAIENATYHDRSLNLFTHLSEILVSCLEKADPYYAGHARATAAFADMLTRRMGLSHVER